MNRTDIEKIEDTLTVKLPNEYIELMIKYPFEEFESGSYPRKALIDDSSEIISINMAFRENGYKKKQWPNNFYILGTTEDIVLFMDLEQSGSAVYQAENDRKFNPKNIRPLKQEDCLEEYIGFVKMLQNIYENP